MDFNDYFYYDETSPSFLRWKASSRYHNSSDVAGKIYKNGYYTVNVNYGTYTVHSIIYKLLGGDIPEGSSVDHLDRNKENNCISNLRCVSVSVNNRNMSMMSRNKTGVVGVCLVIPKKTAPHYLAHWRELDGKKRNKCFAIQKYGNEEAFRLACEYRQNKILELNKQGAGYSDTHGA